MDRKSLVETDQPLISDLERLVDADSHDDPEQPPRRTAKSVRKLAAALRALGHRISHETVARLLRGLGHSLQANAKVREGRQHFGRDAQFEHINATVQTAIDQGRPVISVDTKKEGAGRRLERRARVAPEGIAGPGPRARLQRQKPGQGNP